MTASVVLVPTQTNVYPVLQTTIYNSQIQVLHLEHVLLRVLLGGPLRQ